MHLLYLVKQPLTPRDFDRFGIEFMLGKGNRITVFDLSRVIHPTLPNDQSTAAVDDRIELCVLNDWAELSDRREIFRTCDLVMFFIQGFGLSHQIARPLRMVINAGTPYLIHCAPTYPGWQITETKPSPDKVVRGWLKKLSKVADPLNSVLSRIPPGLIGLKAADFAVQTGTGEKRRNNLIGKKTRKIETHAYDYDMFLELRATSAPPKKQAVFIDQYMPFHHDYEEMGVAPFDADRYFDALNTLFRRVEGELGLEVVIAAHPRAQYDEADNFFDGRTVLKGATAQLILESRLVIGHISLALGYAIMAKKPILLVTTQETYSTVPSERHYYDGFARELGTPLHFIDRDPDFDLTRAFEFDSGKYDDYLFRYVVNPQAEDRQSWQIVLDELNHQIT